MIRLENAVPGQVVTDGETSCYYVRRQLRQIWPESATIIDHYRWAVHGSGQVRLDRPGTEELARITGVRSDQTFYFDIETCGFSGTNVFLIGWCYFDGNDDFVVEQFLARDYSEEAGLLAAAGRRFQDAEILISFNGKRFDMPSILERAVIHRTSIKAPTCHIDLLDHARRRWKSRLPNCRLQTLETLLCRRYRTGDIPGSMIPEVYHDFVRTGDAKKLAMVIQHNLLDVVTLAQVAAHLIGGTEPGE
jgi:hypothetical protein